LLRSSLALLLCGPLLSAAPTDITGQRETSKHPASPEQVYLIIPSDDAGMSHSVNMGLERLIETGLPVSVSAMFPTPWYQETVENELRAQIQRALRSALLDMNKDGALPEMSKNRQGELDALTSIRFRDALKAHNVRLLTYRQLIAIQGLQSMQRPEG
jgi:hypothetical protein